MPTLDSPDQSSSAALVCVRCGYSLHGLPEDGACPECALSVLWMRDSWPLHAAPDAWLRRVQIGYNLVIVVVLNLLALPLLVFLAAGTVAIRPPDTMPMSIWLCVVVIGVSPTLWLIIGLIAVSTPQPRIDRVFPHLRVARRWSLALVGAALSAGVAFIAAWTAGGSPVVRVSLGAASSICALALVWDILSYMERLLRRAGTHGRLIGIFMARLLLAVIAVGAVSFAGCVMQQATLGTIAPLLVLMVIPLAALGMFLASLCSTVNAEIRRARIHR